jgi:hypothetical protein
VTGFRLFISCVSRAEEWVREYWGQPKKNGRNLEEFDFATERFVFVTEEFDFVAEEHLLVG